MDFDATSRSQVRTLQGLARRKPLKVIAVRLISSIPLRLTIFFDFLLAFFGIVAFMKDEMLSYFILVAGAVLMYIFVLKDYSEEAIIRYFANKHGFTVSMLKKIILIYYPCVLILETAIAALAVILK